MLALFLVYRPPPSTSRIIRVSSAKDHLMHMTDHQSDNESLCSYSFSDSLTLETLSDQLNQLQKDVLQMVPTMQTFTEMGTAKKSDTEQQEQVLATLVKMEQTLGGLVSSLNTTTTAINEKTAAAAVAEGPMHDKLEDDMTSPLRDSLRAKIELVKKIMFTLEIQPQKHDVKPMPPGDPASIDDDLYVIWCASPNSRWYKHKLFEMMGSLRSKEEDERKRLRDMKKEREQLNGCSGSGTEDSAHRQYPRKKIAAIKRAAFEFYPDKVNGKPKPALPADASLIDLDVFLVWCLRSDDYKDCQKKDRYAKCTFRDTSKFEQELGCVIENLQILHEEEREYLSLQKEEMVPEQEDTKAPNTEEKKDEYTEDKKDEYTEDKKDEYTEDKKDEYTEDKKDEYTEDKKDEYTEDKKDEYTEDKKDEYTEDKKDEDE